MHWLPEIVHAWREGEYFGPGTDVHQAGDPVSPLDALAMDHDWRYYSAERIGGHRGRAMKASADYEMAMSTDNPYVAMAMFTQATLRVLTFNQIEFF